MIWIDKKTGIQLSTDCEMGGDWIPEEEYKKLKEEESKKEKKAKKAAEKGDA